MSIPRKHHYVPQVHIEKFETENGYNQFLKRNNSFVPKKTAVDIFCVRNLNTTIDEKGEFDHSTVEAELNKNWDSKFSYFHSEIMNWIIQELPNENFNTEISQDCLKFFFEYGIIGAFRRKKMEKDYGIDSIIMTQEMREALFLIDFKTTKLEGYTYQQLESAKSNFFEIFKQIEEIEKREEKLKYRGSIPTRMELLIPTTCSCDVFLASESSFILPDTTSIFSTSGQKKQIDGLIVPVINCVCIPINPYVLLQVKNNESTSNPTTKIYYLNKQDVQDINQKMFNSSFEQVVTIDKEIIMQIIQQQ